MPDEGSTAAAAAGDKGGQQAADSTTTPKTFTQEQVNDLIAREKGQFQQKYADYDDLKAKAGRFDEIERSNQTELERLTGDRDTFRGRAESAESKLAKFEAAAQAGLPIEHAHRISGSTPKELEEDAKKLAEVLGGGGGGGGFDGGARGGGDLPQDMNARLRRAAGRA